jgi:AbrB family looped-hinge helix DNA binding protein
MFCVRLKPNDDAGVGARPHFVGMYASTADAAIRLTGWVDSGDLTGKINQREQMSGTATTTLSSKGQVVIPEEIRERLGLKPGAQFVVIAERDVVIFKVLHPPSRREFSALLGQARDVAKSTGLRRSDITKAVAKVRRSR